MFFARKKLSLKKRGAKLETKKMKAAGETGSDGGTKAHNQKRCPIIRDGKAVKRL